jgi:polyketide synthase PksL
MDDQMKQLYEQIKKQQINPEDAVKLIKQLRTQRESMPSLPSHSNGTDIVGANKTIGTIKQDLLEEKAIEYFKNLLSSVLQLPVHRIEADAPMEKYGIDSVMVMQMTNQLEKIFGSLSKTLLFEYQNIKELTGYFIQNHRETLLKQLNVSIQYQEKLPGSVPEPMNQVPKAVSFRKNRFSTSPDPEKTVRDEDLAIIGISGRYPMAKNLHEFWQNLKDGRDCITEIPSERWDYMDFYNPEKGKKGMSYSKWGGFIDDFDKFDPLFFNIAPRDAEKIDPQERLFLEITWQTIEDAGYTVADLNKFDVGVFVGVMYGHYQLFGVEETQKGNGMALSSSYASIANRISYFFDFKGPSIALDTMCSSSLTSIHLACESIHRGDCQLAIAGGVNLSIHPAKYILLSENTFMASDGRCKSFGVGGDGYVPGEGVGAILIKPLSKAQADGDQIYAIIKASSINHDGKTNGYTVPNPNAQCDLILKAINKANVNPRSISYIEAHGTGTSLGDPIEITGLTKAFGKHTEDKQFCAIGSAKSNIGHLESAAGIAAITKVILQMKYKQLVPSIHSERLNPHIKFEDTPFCVQRELTDWKKPVLNIDGKEVKFPKLAGISSFGAGGANSHIILAEYENNEERRNVYLRPQIVLLSARNKERLKVYAQGLFDFLKSSLPSACSPQNNDEIFLPLLQNALIELIADLLRVSKDDIDIDSTFGDLNLDLINLVELANRVNEKFNLSLVNQIFQEYSSVRELSSYICSQFPDHLTPFHPMGNNRMTNRENPVSLSLDDVAYTLQIGREAKEERLAIVVSDMDDLLEKLQEFCQDKKDIENLYTGNVNESIDTRLEGKTGEELVRSLIQNKELNKLAGVWLTGAKVDWNLLYPAEKPQRISLPTYPFERKRCWYDSFRKKSTTETKETKQQPVRDVKPKQDQNITSKTNLQSAVRSYQGEEVTLQIVNEAIAIITLQDRKHRNMFSENLILGLMAKFGEIKTNEKVKAVIVTGYDNIFAMGGTQEQLMGISDRRMNFTDAPFMYRGLLETDLPVISAIQGHASGGGLLFGLYGDIIVMAEDGIYSAVFTKYGFTPGMGATFILKEKLGNNLATEMMFTAKSFTGEELRNRGASIIFRNSKNVLQEALNIAKMLAEKPVITLKTLKKDLSSRILQELPKYIERESYMHQQTFSNSEVKERIQHYYLDGREFNDQPESSLKSGSLADVLEALETGKITPEDALSLRR